MWGVCPIYESRHTEPLPAAAAVYTLDALKNLRGALDGNFRKSGTCDHMLALHGPLLWLPSLHFGGSWLPSPYEPELVISAILAATVPLCESSDDPYLSLEQVVRQRTEEGSFVAANLLAENASFFGASDDQGVKLRADIEEDVSTRRDALRGSIAQVRKMIDRVQRMGLLRNVDEAPSLLSRLDRIDVLKLPAQSMIEARDEDEEGELILDFVAAESLINQVRDWAQRLLDRPRKAILDDLDNLTSSGKASEDEARRVRGLVDKDDLLTAREFIDFLESGTALPSTVSPNPRFHEFYPAVPDFLGKSAENFALIYEHLKERRDVGPLQFSRIAESRHDDALQLLEEWRGLRQRAHGNWKLETVVPLVHGFLEKIGLRVAMKDVDASLSNKSRHTFVSEMRIDIPTDFDSVLLPDFGSGTGRNYRVCLVSRMPSETELNTLCEHSGTMGIIVLVAGVVGTERRKQLAVQCAKQLRKVLVIDEAIVFYALSEREFRPLTIFECAQPFSYAAPYRDYGSQAVPPEMFFGRATEYEKLLDASGSCIVYGGRRLGKTALLQHIRATKHDPANNMIVVRVDLISIGSTTLPSYIWEHTSREIPELFPQSAKTANEFTSRVKSWLDADARRRVLVLFDEADRFIEVDAQDNFKEFSLLQQLMDQTSRRFKFVLAGLHNVTRLVHTENPPLKQIASDPQRIGPLMHEELKDAELLVTRPLAAMGYEFDNREDVWRILSHCNYYPVLVQAFCKWLLEALIKDEGHNRPTVKITSRHVNAALEDENIGKEIAAMFDNTIQIDIRYALITNIIALRALEDRDAGRTEEGMSAVEVLDEAQGYWPTAFQQVNRLSVTEDLLDEMEGLGILRQVEDGGWALRSHTILRLLGDYEKIATKLLEFENQPPPRPYEPRSMRRPLNLAKVHRVPDNYTCPLTLGQEHDLLTVDRSGQAATRVWAIFGNNLSDLNYVGSAMTTAGPLASDGKKVEIVSRHFTSTKDFLDALAQPRAKDFDRTLLVVDARSPWDIDWVDRALQANPVRQGRMIVAFVGAPEHALRWVSDPRMKRLPAHVRVMPLQPWSVAMIDHHLGKENLSADQHRDSLLKLTGGFNRPMTEIFSRQVSRDRFKGHVTRLHDRLVSSKSLLTDLVGVTPMDEIFARFGTWLADDNSIRVVDISAVILPEIAAAKHLTGEQVVAFGSLMGLLHPGPLKQGEDEAARSYELNPLLAAALAASGKRQAAE